MAVFLMVSLAACSSRPAVPKNPDVPPAPIMVVADKFQVQTPPRFNEEPVCPDSLTQVDPVTGEGRNDELLRNWIACRAAHQIERAGRRVWEDWEDRERAARRRSNVVGGAGS